jgi:hypothetical protein
MPFHTRRLSGGLKASIAAFMEFNPSKSDADSQSTSSIYKTHAPALEEKGKRALNMDSALCCVPPPLGEYFCHNFRKGFFFFFVAFA